MKLKTPQRGINDLHDDFFNRVKGRTVSQATHHTDETTEMHFHELTFSKDGEPDATLPVVPVTALVRPHFMLSRERVQQLQRLLVDKSNELLKVVDSFELAQLHYCIGSVWSASWLPLEAGKTLSTGAVLEENPELDEMNDRAFQELAGLEVLTVDADTYQCGVRYYSLELAKKGVICRATLGGAGASSEPIAEARSPERRGEISVVPMTTVLRLLKALEASGSRSEGAALSGRAERAVPPEASPEGRNAPAEVIARVAVSAPAAGTACGKCGAVGGNINCSECSGLSAALERRALHPLHSVDCEIDNRTEFAITADATFLGTLADKGARYELARCVLTIRNVEPMPGAIWPE